MREIVKSISIPVEGKPLDFRHVCLVSWLNAIGDGSARYAARRNCRTVPDVPKFLTNKYPDQLESLFMPWIFWH